MGGWKDTEIVVWRGGKEDKQKERQHGGEGLEQAHHVLLAVWSKGYRLDSREGWGTGQPTMQVGTRI